MATPQSQLKSNRGILEGLLQGGDVPQSPSPGSSLENEDGSVDVNLTPTDEANPETEQSVYSEENHLTNLVEDLQKSDSGRQYLVKLGQQVREGFEADKSSNGDHFSTLIKGFDMLGTKIQEGTLFKGACGVYHPLIMESAVKFQQKASLELLPSDGPVKVEIIGDPTQEAQEQAGRVDDHMNWQTTTQIPEYYPEKERMLFYLPLVGSAITKLYYNVRLKRPDSFFVPIDRFIVPYGVNSLEKAPRYTEIIYITKSDMQKEINSGLYVDALKDIGEPGMVKVTELQAKTDEFIGMNPTNSKFDGVYTLLEQHLEVSLEGIDDEPEQDKPYIVTIEEKTGKVLSIYRNWKYGDDTYAKLMWYVHYPFVPGIGFYGLGYIHLLGNIQMTLTLALRALIDAGQFANLPAGFKKKGIRMQKDQGPLKPGEFRDVEVLGDKIEDAFMQLPFKGPNPVLFELLQYLDSKGGTFADSMEQTIADQPGYGPVGTTMALLDASAKFFTAVHKRLHFAQKKELSILARLNMQYMDDEFSYNVPGQTLTVYKTDYNDKISIEPVSDPNISSAAQRFSLAQAKLQFVQGLPPAQQQGMNTQPIIASALTALGEKHLDQIFIKPEEAKPMDPLSDIVSVIHNKPIQAFNGQDHDAHIQFKMTWLNDPTQGLNPTFQQFVPLVNANIQQHTIMKYQEQIQGIVNQTIQQDPQLGQQLQPPQPNGANPNDPQVQAQQQAAQKAQGALVAKVEADAAKKVNTANAQIAAGQQNNTPEQLLAQSELMKAQAQVAKVNADIATNQQKVQLQKDSVDLDASKELNRKQEANAKLALDAEKTKSQIGADLSQGAAERVSKFAGEQLKSRTDLEKARIQTTAKVKQAKARKVKPQPNDD